MHVITRNYCITQDKRIEELRRLLKRYRKIEEMVVQVQGRKGKGGSISRSLG